MKGVVIRSFILFFHLFATVCMQAQQDSQYTQYMYNTVSVNPGYAGSRGVTSLFFQHRNQWMGIDGAPVTTVFSINTPISTTNLGLGLTVITDRIGVSDQNSVSIDASYSIPLSQSSKLSFGLKGAANWLSVNYNRLTIRNPNDIVLSQQNELDHAFLPNLGVGIYWHSTKNYVGFSVPHLLETRRYNDNTTTTVTDKTHFYFIAGSVFDLNSDWKFKPAVLMKLVQGAPLQADLSANFLFNQKLTLGLGYRWDVALTGLVGFQIGEAWQIGYAYDVETTKWTHYNSGSHEIFLRYELFQKYSKIVAPRFF